MAETIRLGLLRLCDAAPVILADHEQMFMREDVRVRLFIEPSWANIADKLSYGLLDGAVMLPPLAIACVAGLRGRKTELVVPMGLSANGNAITLASALARDYLGFGIGGLTVRKRLRLAVVHGFSTHDLLLRDWLAAAGADPEKDVEITVLPPAEMVSGLAAGAIDGFCAGAPWGQVAAHAGLGFIAMRSCEIWPDHPEKCLALRADLVARDPAGVTGILRALYKSGRKCAKAEQRPALAALLAQPGYLNLPASLLELALNPDDGGPLFTHQRPEVADEKWFAAKMLRWCKAPPDRLSTVPNLSRPDLFLDACGSMII